MSTAQAIASEQILSAMGMMVEDEKPLIDPDWRTQPTISHEEFFEQLYHEVGALYGFSLAHLHRMRNYPSNYIYSFGKQSPHSPYSATESAEMRLQNYGTDGRILGC